MIYDTHCHPYLSRDKSQEEILENFFWWNGIYLNSIGVDLETSELSISLAKSHTGVYASIGIHPTHCLDYNGKLDETIEKLKKMYFENQDEVVAIWEAWLDYYWLKSLSERYKLSEEEIISLQKNFFKAQIDLARELSVPLIIHNRESADDVMSILQEKDFHNFVFHCYSEDYDYAKRLIEFAPECKLGFGGVVSFKNAQKTQDAAKNIPLENIIIETDSPYLTPVPHRGKSENEPIYCEYVLSTIIDLREESPEEIRTQIFKNSKTFFWI